jgi:2,5-dihydroxypyridine 5,6-dioxygenase
VPVRSTGASEALGKLAPVVGALGAAGFVVDCTIEGLMHAPETPAILKAGARIQVISNEHPEALERMMPDSALEKIVRAAAKMLRAAKRMRVTYGGCVHCGRVGLDREARHAGPLAGWTRRELSQERHRERHARARPWRHQSHV